MKTKRPLLPGDKVKVYGNLKGEIEANGIVATVVENSEEFGPCIGWITVKYKKEFIPFTKHVHPRQCVRLKKKPKPQEKKRIERWYFPPTDNYGEIYSANPQSKEQRWFYLVELREGEFITSKAKLGEAWNTTFCSNVQVSNAPDGSYFKELCEKLGAE